MTHVHAAEGPDGEQRAALLPFPAFTKHIEPLALG